MSKAADVHVLGFESGMAPTAFLPTLALALERGPEPNAAIPESIQSLCPA